VRLALEELKGAGVDVVQNLARFYVYDMSEHCGFSCPESGLFGCRDDSFWTCERNRFFLVRAGREIAGFAVVESPARTADHDMAEFFVLRKFRRRGVGTEVARRLFGMLPGKWSVMQLPENKPAIAFWRRVIADYTSGAFRESRGRRDGHAVLVQRFTSPPRETSG
jgi:predicted acetyltransferase